MLIETKGNISRFTGIFFGTPHQSDAQAEQNQYH